MVTDHRHALERRAFLFPARDRLLPALEKILHALAITVGIARINLRHAFAKRGGRFGSHNMHENYPSPLSWRSDDIVVATFFNGGVRAYDLANPYQPKEIGYFVPGTPPMLSIEGNCSSSAAAPSRCVRECL